MLKNAATCVMFVSAFSSMHAFAACPDDVTAAHPPALDGPAKKSFAHFGSSVLASWYKPWHMAHDVIAKAGTPAAIEAKFDYDAVLHKDLEGERVHAYLYGTGM